MRPRKLAFVALVVLALVLPLLVVAVSFVDFESPALGQELLARANAASGMSLTARSFRLNLSRGLELGDVRARARMPGVFYDLELARLGFEHVPLELLGRRLRVERAIAESPRVTLRVGREADPDAAPEGDANGSATPPVAPSPPAAAAEESAADSSASFLDIDLAVSELVIRDGAFLLLQRGSDQERLLLEKVDLSLASLVFDRNAVTLLHGVTGGGRLAIGLLRFGETVVEGVSSAVDFERGRIELEELELESDGRSWSGRLYLDVNSLPFRYLLSVEGGPFDAAPFVESASFRFEGSGFGLDSGNLSGSGTVSLGGGAFPDRPWVRALEEATGRSGIAGSRYDPSELSFELQDGTLRFEPFPLTGPAAVLTVEGAVSLEGEIALEIAFEGRRYRVGGSLDAPTVAVASAP